MDASHGRRWMRRQSRRLEAGGLARPPRTPLPIFCVSVASLRGVLLSLCALCLGGGLWVEAQVPDTFKNLQVLPKDIQRPELIGRMRSYASALGVRCQHCHVGAEAPDFKGADFASDAKEEKRIARLMIQMERAINQEHLTRLTREKRVAVECATCHRGLRSPRTLEAELLEVAEGKSVDAAIARYRELRASTYGRGGYDFGQGTLNKIGEGLIRANRPADALAFLNVNVEFFPDAPWLLYLLGEAHRALGHREQAIAAYEKAMALEPDNPMARRRLQELAAKPSPAP